MNNNLHVLHKILNLLFLYITYIVKQNSGRGPQYAYLARKSNMNIKQFCAKSLKSYGINLQYEINTKTCQSLESEDAKCQNEHLLGFIIFPL